MEPIPEREITGEKVAQIFKDAIYEVSPVIQDGDEESFLVEGTLENFVVIVRKDTPKSIIMMMVMMEPPFQESYEELCVLANDINIDFGGEATLTVVREEDDTILVLLVTETVETGEELDPRRLIMSARRLEKAAQFVYMHLEDRI